MAQHLNTITVKNFGTVKVARVNAGGRIEIHTDLVNENGKDLVTRAVNAFPRLRRRQIKGSIIVLEVNVRKIDRAGRTNYLKKVAADFLAGIQKTASSEEMQDFFNRQPAYVFDVVGRRQQA